jgi:hypothetical protein
MGHGQESSHTIALLADWTVETPHDLEAERLAEILGSRVSCLDLVDCVLPAVRQYVQVVARRTEFPLRLRPQGDWEARRRHPDCCEERYADPALAAQHARSARHVAHLAGVAVEQVEAIGAEVLAAHGGDDGLAPDPRSSDAVAWVEPADGILDLWRVGIHPQTVEHIWRTGVRRAAPARYYLGVVANEPDLDWIRSTAEVAPTDSELLADLAWSEAAADRADPTCRAAWLRLGAPSSLSASLSGAAVRPDQARRPTDKFGGASTTVTRQLSAWVRAATPPPTLALLRALRQAGVPSYHEPNPRAVARLAEILEAAAITMTMEDTVALLAAAGSVSAALSWIMPLDRR